MKQYSPEIEAILSDAAATRLLALDSVGNVVETTRPSIGNTLTSTHVPYWNGTQFEDSSISQNVASGVSATFTLNTNDAIGFHEPDMVAYARNTNFPAPSLGVVVGQGVSITFPNDFTVADLVQAGVTGTAVGTDVLIAAGTYTGGVVTSLQGNGGAFEFSLPNLSLPDFSANDFTVFINIAGANNQVGVEITLIGTDPGLNITDLAVGTPAANSILALDANNNVVLTAGGGVSGTTGTIPVFDASADGVGDSLITQTGAGVTFALGFADFNNTGGATTTTIFSDNLNGPAQAADLSLLQVGDVITVPTATPVATFTVTDISNVPTSVTAERTTGPTTNLDAFESSVTRGGAAAGILVSANLTVTGDTSLTDVSITGATMFPNGLTVETGGNISQVNSLNLSGAFGVNFNDGTSSGGTVQQSGFNVNSTGNTSIGGNFNSFSGSGQTTIGRSSSSTRVAGTNVTNPATGTTTVLGIDENGAFTTTVDGGGNFVDLTTAQSIAGTKTFTDSFTVTANTVNIAADERGLADIKTINIGSQSREGGFATGSETINIGSTLAPSAININGTAFINSTTGDVSIDGTGVNSNINIGTGGDSGAITIGRANAASSISLDASAGTSVNSNLTITGTTSFPNGLTLDTGGNIRQVNSMNISGAFGVNFNNGVDSGGTTQQSGFNVNSTGNTSISGNFSSFNGTGQTELGTGTSSTRVRGTNVTNPAIGLTTALGIDENGALTTNVSSGVSGTGLVRSDLGVLSIDTTFLSSGATINLPTADFDAANVTVESSVITTGGNVSVVQIVFNTGQVTGLVDGMTYSTYTHTFGGNTDVFSTVTWTYIAESNPDRAFGVGQSRLYALGDNTTPVSDRGTDFAALGLLTPPTAYSVTEFIAASISTLGTGVVRADAGVLSIDTSIGDVILPAPDVIDHLTNPVYTTPTSITLSPTINIVGNYSQFLLSAFYVTGSQTDPGTIIRTGTQTAVQTIATPMVGATPTIPITGLVANVDYSFVIVVAFDGGYFVSEVEERLTANDTQPTVTISTPDLTPDAGDAVVLTVVSVDNEGDQVFVQWQFDQGSTGVFVDIVGETNATYTIAAYAAAANDGAYRVQASSSIFPTILSNVLTLAESQPPGAPARGGGLTSIASGSMMITNALGGNAGSGTPGDPVVNSTVFGSRYPEYGGQTVGTGDGFNMSAITFGDPTTGGSGSNFGNGTGVTLADFNAAGNTVTSTFPAGNGTEINSANGFNTAFGCSGLAPTTAGVYDLNINLASGESGLYQLQVGGGGGVTTHETPVTVNTTGTVSLFQSAFIGLPGGTTQNFTLGPATDNTSADCFIATNFPTDLGTVGVTLTPASAALSFGYAGFSGDIRWFAFRGVPDDLGTATHTITVNGAPANSGPPLITWSGAITGSTAPSTTTTFSLDVTVGSIGGGAISSVVVNFQTPTTPDITLTNPVGGWLVGQTYSFTGLSGVTNANGQIVLQLEATNVDGTYTTILNTIL